MSTTAAETVSSKIPKEEISNKTTLRLCVHFKQGIYWKIYIFYIYIKSSGWVCLPVKPVQKSFSERFRSPMMGYRYGKAPILFFFGGGYWHYPGGHKKLNIPKEGKLPIQRKKKKKKTCSTKSVRNCAYCICAENRI